MAPESEESEAATTAEEVAKAKAKATKASTPEATPAPSSDEENDAGNSNKVKDNDNDNDNASLNSNSNSSESGTPEKLPIFEFMTGIKNDLKVRLPIYKDDWSRPQSILKVVNATFYAFVVQLIPALIFAELLDRQTEGNLAVAETLLSSGIIGIMFAILGGQPLLLLGITGPVALLLGTSYGLAEQFDSEYFPFFWWVCIWGALLHCITAMVGLVNFVWTITPFTTQIFELFIAMTFIYQSIKDMVTPIGFAQDENDDRNSGYASLVIGVMTFYLCWTLHFADTWQYFTRQLRTFLEAYNMMIALIIATAFSYLPGVDQDSTIERVNIRFTPWDWQPTADRAWLVDPFEGISTGGIFAALFPALMLYLLFFIDHNVSAILTQHPKFNLKKPAAYHWDFFVLGLTIIPCGLMGLPPGNCLIPQGPLHTRALCTRTFKEIHGVRREVVTYCEEQRWSGLGQAILMIVSLACMEAIAWIPVGCLFGVFLYLGVGALHGNEIWERVTLMFIMPHKRPPMPVVTETSSWWVVQSYTIIQVVLTATCFAVGQFADIGYIFPALIAALVPFRSYIITCFFSPADLEHLDPLGFFGELDNKDDDDDEDENAANANQETAILPAAVSTCEEA